jgi:hypothetical protein
MSIDFERTHVANDVATTLSLRSLPYNMVEFKLARKVLDDEGFIIQESETRMYPSHEQLKEMLLPFINHLKEFYDKQDNSGKV